MIERWVLWAVTAALFGQGQEATAPVVTDLAGVRRIYVDLLSGGESAQRIRDMLINSLQNSKVFTVTENIASADAIVRGSALDSAFMETFSSSDSLTAHSSLTLPTSKSGGRASSKLGGAMSIGEHDSLHTNERKHEATATIRLVARNGDVIWTTTQESKGGKFLGASADVADKIAKKLIADLRQSKAGIVQSK